MIGPLSIQEKSFCERTCKVRSHRAYYLRGVIRDRLGHLSGQEIFFQLSKKPFYAAY